MPTTTTSTANNTNDAYKKMPDTPIHGGLDSYDQEDTNNKEEHRGGFWHALMSLMTCGTH
jgi:hypothetical protein